VALEFGLAHGAAEEVRWEQLGALKVLDRPRDRGDGDGVAVGGEPSPSPSFTS
jgi:hypothetical protein